MSWLWAPSGCQTFWSPGNRHDGKGSFNSRLRPARHQRHGHRLCTSNRGACHLRAYTPAAEVIGNVLGPSTLTDPLEWKGKGELTVIFQNVIP